MVYAKQTTRKSSGGKFPRRQFTSKAKCNVHYSISARKPRRFQPGTVVLREICRYQKRTKLLLSKLPFKRLVCKISNNIADK